MTLGLKKYSLLEHMLAKPPKKESNMNTLAKTTNQTSATNPPLAHPSQPIFQQIAQISSQLDDLTDVGNRLANVAYMVSGPTNQDACTEAPEHKEPETVKERLAMIQRRLNDITLVLSADVDRVNPEL